MNGSLVSELDRWLTAIPRGRTSAELGRLSSPRATPGVALSYESLALRAMSDVACGSSRGT